MEVVANLLNEKYHMEDYFSILLKNWNNNDREEILSLKDHCKISLGSEETSDRNVAKTWIHSSTSILLSDEAKKWGRYKILILWFEDVKHKKRKSMSSDPYEHGNVLNRQNKWIFTYSKHCIKLKFDFNTKLQIELVNFFSFPWPLECIYIIQSYLEMNFEDVPETLVLFEHSFTQRSWIPIWDSKILSDIHKSLFFSILMFILYIKKLDNVIYFHPEIYEWHIVGPDITRARFMKTIPTLGN